MKKTQLKVVPLLSAATVLVALGTLVWYTVAMGGFGPRAGSIPADPLSIFSLGPSQAGGQGPSFEVTFVAVLLSVMAGYIGGMVVALKFSSRTGS